MAQVVTAKNEAGQNDAGAGAAGDNQAQKDIAAQEQLLSSIGQFSEEAVLASRAYKENEALVKHEILDQNEYYRKLRNRINAFFVLCEKYRLKGPTEQQEDHFRKSGYTFEYRKGLYQSLKNLMVKCTQTKPYKNQAAYIRNVYVWFFYKLVAMGDLSKQEQENELRFINPTINQLQNKMKAIVGHKYSSHLCNEEEMMAVNKAMFEEREIGGAERSLLGELQPANQRIKEYKTKTFGALYDEKVEEIKKKDAQLLQKKRQNHRDSCQSGMQCAHLGSIYDDYELKPKDDLSTQASTQMSERKRPFSQSERASRRHPFKTFYTNDEVEVKFETKNRFEGRSNYFSYLPTGDLVNKEDEEDFKLKHVEQKLETWWFNNKNRALAEKRRDEENMQIMNEWANARGRMEAEIQRRKEHLNFATKFEQARGFVRTNWKTKNFDPNDDPTQYSHSTDEEEEYDQEIENEAQDVVPGEEALVRKEPFPSTAEQKATLKAIQEYNDGLKPARKGKDEIGEIECNNLTSQSRYKEHPKTKKKMEFKVYKEVGIIEGDGDDEGRYSVEAKAKSIQRAASQHKIDKIRQLQGKLIGADKVPTQQALYYPYTLSKDPQLLAPKPVDNPFEHEDDDREISLSIYSQPKAVAKRRPLTAKTASEMLQFIPGYKAPPTIGPDGATVPSVPYEPPPKSARPDAGDGLHLLESINMADCDKVRQDEMRELLELRDRLAWERHEVTGRSLADANNENMKALMRAVLQPDVNRYLPKDKKYPATGAQYNLMPNPFPAKKKGKKGKKKKR